MQMSKHFTFNQSDPVNWMLNHSDQYAVTNDDLTAMSNVSQRKNAVSIYGSTGKHCLMLIRSCTVFQIFTIIVCLGFAGTKTHFQITSLLICLVLIRMQCLVLRETQ